MNTPVEISAARPEVGSWSLAVEAPAGTDWNAVARRMLGAFATAFRDLLPVREVTADALRLDQEGTVVGVAEAAEVRLGPDFEVEVDPPGAGEVLITAVRLGCALRGEDGLTPGAAEFFYGCDVEYDEHDHARPVDAQAIVTIYADVWHEQANRERLESALRRWERTSGATITAWHSATRPELVARYGFRQA